MPDPRATPPAIDDRALRHVLARLARADGPPWLHQEVARRMAARLPVIRQPPADWLDWWAFTGAGAGPVQAVWPQARRQAVEPTPELQARSRLALAAPWWALAMVVVGGLLILSALTVSLMVFAPSKPVENALPEILEPVTVKITPETQKAVKVPAPAVAVPKELAEKIQKGGVGVWGQVPMPANQVTPDEAKQLAAWVLSIK